MRASVAVLGGGAAGVVAAQELAARGATVDLIERQEQLGGLHRSVVLDGDAFDTGVFLFSHKHEFVKSFPALRSEFISVNSPRLSLTPDGTLDKWPISAGGYLRSHGLLHTGRAVCSLLVSKVRDRRRATVAEFAQFHIGRQLYTDTGLRHYIERLYGVPDSEVGIEFASQRLGYIENFVKDRLRARTRQLISRRVQHSKPDAFLVRPREGFGFLYGRIRELLEQSGVRVHLNCPLQFIRKVAKGYELQLGEHVHHYDEVVSTVPIPVLLRLAGESLQSRVEHMGLLSLFYRGMFLPEAAVLCNFTYESRWKRLCVFSYYYGRSGGEDFLTVEVTGSDLSPARQRELSADFEEHAMRHRLFRERPRLLSAVVTEHAYPIFRRGHTENVQRESELLGCLGIRTVGRQGNHKYLSSHDAVREAKELVRSMPFN